MNIYVRSCEDLWKAYNDVLYTSTKHTLLPTEHNFTQGFIGSLGMLSILLFFR